MKEEFKVIKEFENYEINRNGEVRNIKTGKILKNKLDDKKFYFKTSLIKYYSGKSKQHNVFIHRLLAIAFIENIDNKPIVDHVNGIKTDNRLENLRWATYKENSKNVDYTKIKRKERKENTSRCGINFNKKINEWIVKHKNKTNKFSNLDDAYIFLKNILP